MAVAGPKAQLVGELVWPIRYSFLTYVDALAGSEVAISGGATRDSLGFHFIRSQRPGVGLAFEGAVAITAHDGALQVELRDPEIVVDGGVCKLLCDTGRGRVAVATLLDGPQSEQELDSWSSDLSDVALTHDGASWLGGVYSPWTRVDPVQLVTA